MRLLYLYIESYRCVRPEHPVEINFTTDFRFSLQVEGSHRKLVCVKSERPLPEGFFNIGEGASPVTEVSGVFGENGSGKTTLASFLQRCRMADAKKNRFVMVFETIAAGNYWQCVSTMNEVDFPRDGATPKDGFVWGGNPMTDYLAPEVLIEKSFDYVYYSPYFTLEQAFDVHDDPSCVNLSTSYLLTRRPERYYNKTLSPDDNISMRERGYATEQKLWELEFAAEYVKWSSDSQRVVDIPAPRIVLMAPNAGMADVSEAVLLEYAQGTRFAYQGTDPKFVAEIAQKALDVAKVMDGMAGDFFFGSLRTFVLNYFRNVNLADKKAYQSLDVFGTKLLEELPKLFPAPRDFSRLSNDIVAKLESWSGFSSAILNAAGVTSVVSFFRRVAEICNPFRTTDKAVVGNIPFQQEHFTGEESDLRKLIVWHGQSVPINSYISVEFEPAMSSGESTYLSLFARLYWYLKHRDDNKKDVLIFLDEAETSLHPEWQRRLVSSVIVFLKQVATDYSVHVMFASHSPLILSDIPIRNAVFLKRDYENREFRKGAYSRQVTTDNADIGYTNSFGASIVDLFAKSFFLDECMIGCFAMDKIRQVADGKVSNELAKEIAQMVGDPFYHSILDDDIREMSWQHFR